MVTPRSVFPMGLSATSLLGLVLVILKLSHVIDWSWWWVSAPFWGLQALFAASLALAALVGLLAGIFSTEPDSGHPT
ncbi:hypothetical protein J2X19_001381 [Rhodoferax ferrireducens]|uniref:Transmembrane protein n=1 Tax=Rhodoferax ferrireducens TaxID=192843 RepID=A0ABU2C5V5_9BURK|nr:hypothetical protein [Rhodoferax ferrireducens]MDR7376723.1 hypothetical protein [Rhodoferax ferrireducens]